MQKLIVTNNPLVVAKKVELPYAVDYREQDFVGNLQRIRDYVHKGYSLLTHPLSGSVKPLETPYKSVLLSSPQTGQSSMIDVQSLELIENALASCLKFNFQTQKYAENTLLDFQLIDWSLLESALVSCV